MLTALAEPSDSGRSCSCASSAAEYSQVDWTVCDSCYPAVQHLHQCYRTLTTRLLREVSQIRERAVSPLSYPAEERVAHRSLGSDEEDVFARLLQLVNIVEDVQTNGCERQTDASSGHLKSPSPREVSSPSQLSPADRGISASEERLSGGHVELLSGTLSGSETDNDNFSLLSSVRREGDTKDVTYPYDETLTKNVPPAAWNDGKLNDLLRRVQTMEAEMQWIQSTLNSTYRHIVM